MKKFPKVTEIKEKAGVPVKTVKIAVGAVISLATAAATIIYLLNKYQGSFDLSKVPSPDQILNFKKKKAE